MGSFYTNVTVVGVSVDEVSELGIGVGPAFAISVGDDVVVFAAADDEGSAVSAPVLARLLDRLVIAASVFDDDLLHLEVWRSAGLLGSITAPDPSEVFGEDVEMFEDLADEEAGGYGPSLSPGQLVDALGRGDAARVDEVLGRSYVFATERHLDLLDALELPLIAAGTGYRYLHQSPDDRPPELVELSTL